MTADRAPASSQDVVNEYEREPVPERARLGFRSFVGQYAGEHTAGTELMIGPLFVAAGVSAFDLVVGLFVGNLLAVLSWMFMTAPIATRARLTLYYQLEQICGRRLAVAYNLANGVMFCFLAGSMITVSATALGVWFDFAMPQLNDVYPNSLGWIVAVLLLGSAVTLVAAYGYAFVARVANIASPWMVLVFLAFGLVGLRQLGVDSSRGCVECRANGDLDRWRSAAGPGEVHLLAHHVLRLVLQHGDAYRHGGSHRAALRQAIVVRRRHGGRYVPRTLSWPGLRPQSSTSSSSKPIRETPRCCRAHSPTAPAALPA